MHTVLCWGNLREGDQGVGCMDWIDLAYDRDRWRALVNVNVNVVINARNFLTSSLHSQDSAPRS
jgi:hypothetical protein